MSLDKMMLITNGDYYYYLFSSYYFNVYVNLEVKVKCDALKWHYE